MTLGTSTRDKKYRTNRTVVNIQVQKLLRNFFPLKLLLILQKLFKIDKLFQVLSEMNLLVRTGKPLTHPTLPKSGTGFHESPPLGREVLRQTISRGNKQRRIGVQPWHNNRRLFSCFHRTHSTLLEVKQIYSPPRPQLKSQQTYNSSSEEDVALSFHLLRQTPAKKTPKSLHPQFTPLLMLKNTSKKKLS